MTTDTAIAPSLRSYEFWPMQYRRSWRATISVSLLTPVLSITFLGLGVGHLVDQRGVFPGGRYLDYLAPGLLAITAVQVAATEGMWGVLGAIRWHRTYYAMVTTPLRVGSVLVGHQLWIATRVLASSVIYLAVIAAFGAVHSPLFLLSLPAAVLVGLATSLPLAAFVAYVAHERLFGPIFAYVLGPMIFLSGTFFPISALPVPVRPLAWVSPFWHGAELCRGFTLGPFQPGPAVLHAAFLLAWIAVAALVTRRSYHRRFDT